MNQLKISIDLEDYSAGLMGTLEADGFRGFGEGWFNTSEVVQFCNDVIRLTNFLEGELRLSAGESKSDGSEFLETFGLSIYTISKTGIFGAHVNLCNSPDTGCRTQELYKVSGELKIETQSLLDFSRELHALCLGEAFDAKLLGR